MRILLTGHTGFKGAWLSLILKERGHEVIGLSLEAEPLSLFNLIRDEINFTEDLRVDIRNRSELISSVKRVKPDYIFHLAAQPLVSEGYNNPLETFDVNFTGTLNVLYAAHVTETVRGITVVTTDKVYRNNDGEESFKEDSPLGGFDPYSASKSAADILAQSWSSIATDIPITVVRAGNVIGGGDFAHHRLVPDLVRTMNSGVVFEIRHPEATRPWQHVLDCLSGYLSAADHGLCNSTSQTWNIGPEKEDCKTVREFIDKFESQWTNSGRKILETPSELNFKEATTLFLDTKKARTTLNWNNSLKLDESIRLTVKWYKVYSTNEIQAIDLCKNELDKVKVKTIHF